MTKAAFDKIKAIVRGHGEVMNLHDLRTRSAGVHTFIQLHIELDPKMNGADRDVVAR